MTLYRILIAAAISLVLGLPLLLGALLWVRFCWYVFLTYWREFELPRDPYPTPKPSPLGGWERPYPPPPPPGRPPAQTATASPNEDQ